MMSTKTLETEAESGNDIMICDDKPWQTDIILQFYVANYNVSHCIVRGMNMEEINL